jgi:hypothetical protein
MRLELLNSMTDHLEIFSSVAGPLRRGLVVIISDADITKI